MIASSSASLINDICAVLASSNPGVNFGVVGLGFKLDLWFGKTDFSRQRQQRDAAVQGETVNNRVRHHLGIAREYGMDDTLGGCSAGSINTTFVSQAIRGHSQGGKASHRW